MLRRGTTEIRVRLTDSSVLQPTRGSFRRKVVVRKYQVTVEMLGARPQMCRRTPCRTFGLACSCGTAWRVDAPLLPIMNVALRAKQVARGQHQLSSPCGGHVRSRYSYRVTPEARVASAAPGPRARLRCLSPEAPLQPLLRVAGARAGVRSQRETS